MLSVEIKRPDGACLAQLDIVPMVGIAERFAPEQYKTAQYLAPRQGLEFYFYVTSDWIYGWRVGEIEPRFRERTPEVLALYAGSTDEVGHARGSYLSGLVESWLADLATRWKSGTKPAPAEEAVRKLGLLQPLQQSYTISTGARP